MESPPPPLQQQPPVEADVGSAANPTSGDSSLTVEKHIKPNTTTKPTVIKKKINNKKKKNVPSDSPQQSLNSVSSSSSTSNNLHSRTKGIRLSTNRRNPRVFSGPVSRRHNGGEADALALPLGMSIAAFVAQVLEKKDADGEKMSADHLSEICTLAVKESLSNVFGDRFDSFASNFERSFQSTLMTLRAISESSENKERSYVHAESSSNYFHLNLKENTSTNNIQEEATIDELDEDNNNVHHRYPIYNELAVIHDSRNGQNGQYGQQLTCIPPNQTNSTLTPYERFVYEQTRSNNLKELEIGLKVQKMRLTKEQIAINCDSNYLERFKLSMGISKANFKAGKFKTELQDSRHAQLLKHCVDCLVAGLLIMVACLAYGTYIHSHQRLIEANESCMLIKESSSWWIPKSMSTFNFGFKVIWCQVQVISRMLFGILMIISITYLLIQRSGTANQTMPITFILLLLGVGCGFAGKFCIDTLGGSGIYWLFFWEILCLLHLFANICTSMLFLILHGPVTVVDGSPNRMVFPYWLRRVTFYAALLVYLPLLCGLMPFAGVGEWLEHFASLVASGVSEIE